MKKKKEFSVLNLFDFVILSVCLIGEHFVYIYFCFFKPTWEFSIVFEIRILMLNLISQICFGICSYFIFVLILFSFHILFLFLTKKKNKSDITMTCLFCCFSVDFSFHFFFSLSLSIHLHFDRISKWMTLLIFFSVSHWTYHWLLIHESQMIVFLKKKTNKS